MEPVEHVEEAPAEAPEDYLQYVDVTLKRSRGDEKWGLVLWTAVDTYSGCAVRDINKDSPADRWNAECPLPQYEIRIGDVWPGVFFFFLHFFGK